MIRRPKRRSPAPSIIALAGPNGAGKSTAGPALVRDALGVTHFVNADIIARGLAACNHVAVVRQVSGESTACCK